MHLNAARRHNLMFPTCLGYLRKLSGRPTASTARCACELTSRLRFVAVLLRPDRLMPLILLLLTRMRLWPIRRKGGYAFVVIADCPTFFDTQGGGA